MVQVAAHPDPLAERQLPRKRQILDAAGRVFRRRGLHAAGMREIAAELGMHAGNLYYYFRSKEELVAFCQRDALTNLLDLAAAVSALPASPEEKLRRLVIGHVVCLNETTPGSLAHLEPEALGEGWRPAIEADRVAYEAFIRRLIDDGVRAGVFRPVNAKVAAMTLLGALNWTVKWYRRDGARTPWQIGEELADLLLGGFAARAAPRREGRATADEG